jgi:NADP-dependent 3-hydroxy acid dehydrogenase YdfG
MTNQKPIALISGASSGIGEACAYTFAENNYDLILMARRIHKLEELKSKIEDLVKGCRVHIIQLDVRKAEEVQTAVQKIPDSFKSINVLVNNAGLAAGLSTLENGNIDHWERMIDTNVKGILYLTKACIPLLKKQEHSHIVNVGSIAGKEVYMNGNVYCSTKHAVDALTKAMRLELSEYPIKVTGVHPGAVETEFSIVRFDGDEKKAQAVYDGYYNLEATDIADAIFWSVDRPAHVNINDLVIMPTAQPKAGVIHKNKK